MTSETLQIGGIIGIVIALIELVKFVIVRYTSNDRNKGNGKNSEQDVLLGRIDERLKVIENHYYHELVEIKDWTKNHEQTHKDEREMLLKIMGKLDIN